MEGVPEQFDSLQDRAEFRRPAGRPGVELYRAHIVRHAFAPHAHPAFGFGTVEQGAERFRYGGSEYLAAPGSVLCMHPDALHTGRSAVEGGWRYCNIYLDPVLLAEIAGEPDWWFADVVAHAQRPQAAQILALHRALWQAGEPLAVDSLLAQLVHTLRPLARVPRPAAASATPRFDGVLDFMRASLEHKLSLDALAAVAGLSPFHFLRCFQAAFHVTPQQMLMALRLDRAKQLLAAGMAPARVAAAAGLCDQAHLTRAFRQRYGTTPAIYQRQVRR